MRVTSVHYSRVVGMEPSPVFTVAEQEIRPMVPDPVSHALRTSKTFVAACAVYGDVLERLVFVGPPPNCDKKELLRLKKCLRNDEAFRIFLLIWKESEFVTDAVLAKNGLTRTFKPGTLNAWNAATATSATTGDVAKTNSRIRSVAYAGEKFGLIERGSDGQKRPLIPTDLLHRVVLEVTSQQSIFFADNAGRTAQVPLSPNPTDHP
jgi:hypothetical protein